MFPELDLNLSNKEIQENGDKEKQSINFIYDFELGDFIIRDGRLIEVENKEAIKIWIEKTLKTEKFKFAIYKDVDYGTNIKSLIQGRKMPQFFLQSELRREIEETLKKHNQIDRIEDFRTEQELSLIKIYFKVILKNNETFNQEVKL